MDTDKIEDAASAGFNAFWDEVAQHFPEIKSGDLPPEQHTKLMIAMRSAVYGWLWANKEEE